MENSFNKFRKELREGIRLDLLAGILTIQDIAVKHSTTITTVYSVMKENGLRRKDREAGRCTAPPATADQTKGEK